ncbi:Tryptophan 2,3-dioxygenase [Cupriavidus campinensis]|uniref:tryptophan 2,3-dioxygenase n=1 Tax=Cupriavidus campinensis TaxID=151783 RepID=UPI001B0B056D|nr:tryptophan 2,3-dioxygenase family protein [Cupriavidus campinensis]CAG2139060.1 Tryptophan 2,3-dioxygenase [Cupriavidus campinensis]
MDDSVKPERAAPASASPGQTPYSAWMRTDVLHSLQHPVSDHPGEHAWITSVQVSELYWMLIIKELRIAQAQLRANDLAQAIKTLQRVVAHHEPLNATWRSLAWMTPTDLLAILSRAVATFGKDTALQGWTYRQMVYLLGIKQGEHLQHFEPQPARWDQLNTTLHQPSVYDDVLGYLDRHGFPVPAAVFQRDFSQPYTPSKDVEKAWRDVYADPHQHLELQHLGETLADVAEGFSAWKHLHLMATRRTFGARPAYFGSEGVAWLVPTMAEIPFPELWSARGFIGDPPAACPHMHKQGGAQQ